MTDTPLLNPLPQGERKQIVSLRGASATKQSRPYNFFNSNNINSYKIHYR